MAQLGGKERNPKPHLPKQGRPGNLGAPPEHAASMAFAHEGRDIHVKLAAINPSEEGAEIRSRHSGEGPAGASRISEEEDDEIPGHHHGRHLERRPLSRGEGLTVG